MDEWQYLPPKVEQTKRIIQPKKWASQKVEKPKPPISSIGCTFEKPQFQDVVDKKLVQISVDHISFIPAFRHFTVEELRYYDYVSFDKIPHWLDHE